MVREDETTWFVRVVELPGCISEGDSPAEAIEMIQDAMAAWLEIALEDGRHTIHRHRTCAGRWPLPCQARGYTQKRGWRSFGPVLAYSARRAREADPIRYYGTRRRGRSAVGPQARVAPIRAVLATNVVLSALFFASGR